MLQFFAFLSGLLLSVQAGLNGKLKVAVGSPVMAAIISFVVGLFFLVVAAIVRKDALPTAKTWAGIHPTLYIGGLLGALYVASATVIFPKLGALQTTGLVVAGQMIASFAIDHFGLLGMPVQSFNVYRACAAVLLLAGVWLSGYKPA